ncbi:hypothetical protein CR513_21694, partial [Mucuna pruriens]
MPSLGGTPCFPCLKLSFLVLIILTKSYELCANRANGGFYRHDGFLFKDKRLCVPKSSIRELLVKKAHEGGLLGNFGSIRPIKICKRTSFCPT